MTKSSVTAEEKERVRREEMERLRNTWCVGYGVDKWSKLFTPRQLLVAGVLAKNMRAAVSQLRQRNDEIAEVIGAYLALVIDRVIDRNSAVCSWTVDWDKVRNTFARFALPMTWDFCEVNPLIETSGGYPGQLELVARFCDHIAESFDDSPKPAVVNRSALAQQNGPNALVLTDPPYYDAIAYSVLMDFFYVWLRRMLFGITEEIDKAI